jgi:tetratricopeptide (TPR) repeat protein
MPALRKFLDEIRHPSLWQVLGVYLAGGWAVFTVILDVSKALLLPSWVVRYSLALLLVGLPITLVTWYVQQGLLKRGVLPQTGMRRVFTWRNALAGGVLAFAALGLVTAVRIVMPTALPQIPVGSAVPQLAIFPATVRGDADSYLHEGIVDLLRGKLAVMANVQMVDPGTAIKAAGMQSQEVVVDVARAATIAGERGWSLFILPVITGSRGKIRLQASLFDTASPEEPLALAEAGGDVAEVFDHIDMLAVDLVLAQFGRASAGLVRSAFQMTEAPAAWENFLRGEQAMRRSQYEVALEAFQTAAEADTTFALAYFRTVIVAALMEADGSFTHLVGSAPNALPHARALMDRLDERDREFLDAYEAFRAGDGNRAEEAFKTMLVERPGDVEARFFLAQTLMRLNPARGRSALEARPVFEEVLRADPGFTCPI